MFIIFVLSITKQKKQQHEKFSLFNRALFNHCFICFAFSYVFSLFNQIKITIMTFFVITLLSFICLTGLLLPVFINYSIKKNK